MDVMRMDWTDLLPSEYLERPSHDLGKCLILLANTESDGHEPYSRLVSNCLSTGICHLILVVMLSLIPLHGRSGDVEGLHSSS